MVGKHEHRAMGRSGARRMPTRGADAKGAGMDKIRADTEVDCAFCKGTGHDRFGLLSPPSACQVCLGRGVVDVPEPRVSCAFCRGSGVHPHTRLTCGGCGGKGLPDGPGSQGDLCALPWRGGGPAERAPSVLSRLPRSRVGARPASEGSGKVSQRRSPGKAHYANVRIMRLSLRRSARICGAARESSTMVRPPGNISHSRVVCRPPPLDIDRKIALPRRHASPG